MAKRLAPPMAVTGSYAATVRDASYRIADADIDSLVTAGHSEDVIVELIVAAAIGAALGCYDAGRRALNVAD